MDLSLSLFLSLNIFACQADAEGRDSWLASSNVAANTGFYNSLGYNTIAMFVVGEDNPTWKGSPIVVAIVRAFIGPLTRFSG